MCHILLSGENNLNKEHPTAVYESINTGLWSDSFFTRINIYYYTKLQNLLNECIYTNFLVFVSVVTFFQLELSSSVTYGRFNYQRILLGCTIKSPAKILALTEQYSMSIDFLMSDSVVSCPPKKSDSAASWALQSQPPRCLAHHKDLTPWCPAHHKGLTPWFPAHHKGLTPRCPAHHKGLTPRRPGHYRVTSAVSCPLPRSKPAVLFGQLV